MLRKVSDLKDILDRPTCRLFLVSAAIAAAEFHVERGYSVRVCGCTGTMVTTILTYFARRKHLSLAGNDTVLISMWPGEGVHSSECRLFLPARRYDNLVLF